MLKKLLFGILLFNTGLAFGQLNPGNFEIRLVDLAGNQVGIEMRAIDPDPAPHGNGTCTLSGENTLILDIIFTLKCPNCESTGDISEVYVENCTFSEMESFGYAMNDQAPQGPENGFYLHGFGAQNTPYDSPADWPLNVWIPIVTVNHAADVDPANITIVTWDEAIGTYGLGTEPNISLDEGSGEIAYTPEVEGVLPLDLLSFKAQKYQDRSSILNWSTANEVNTSHFVVERSVDRVNWSEAGKVQASGESQAVLQYQFIDVDVYDGRKPNARYYYRLQLVDSDGRAEKSNIEIVQFSSDVLVAEVFVFPNPSSAGVNVELNYNQDTAQPAEILLYNELGQLIYQQQIADGSSLEYIDYTRSNISSGAYTLQVMDQTNGILTTEKLIVQR